MGDIGLYKWSWMMNEHKQKGHHLIQYQYPDWDDKKSAKDDEQENLFLKDQRVAFWEKHNSIPTINDLLWWEREVNEVKT